MNYNGQHPYGRATKGLYRGETIDVGSLGIANGFGLYDMHGNVWEWCQDVWHQDYTGAPSDGSAWEGGEGVYERVVRGGLWNRDGRDCRTAVRNRVNSLVGTRMLGFRVVLSLLRLPL